MRASKKISAVLVTAVVAMCLACVGCAPSEQAEDAAAQNRAYMSQANTMAIQLNADLEPFTAAVAAGDVVTMEQSASAVYRDIDAIKALKAPDAMKDIHTEYSAGCEDLKGALQAYVAAYSDAADTDVSALNEALSAVQEQYDSGIAHLRAADKMVTELTGALPSSSSSAATSSSSQG